MNAAGEYERLLRALHDEIRAGRSDGAEADRLRDAMDAPWRAMTGEERERAGRVSDALRDAEASWLALVDADHYRLTLAVHIALANLRKTVGREPSVEDLEREASRVATEEAGVPVRATISADGVLTLTLPAKVETVTFSVGVRGS